MEQQGTDELGPQEVVDAAEGVEVAREAEEAMSSAEPDAITDDDKTAPEASAGESSTGGSRKQQQQQQQQKKKNFSLKKQLSKADSKLRDLLINRRGSAVSASSPSLPPSKPVSPLEENSAFTFCEILPAAATPSSPAEELTDGPKDVMAPPSCNEVEGGTAPVRPPRKLKKSDSVTTATTTTTTTVSSTSSSAVCNTVTSSSRSARIECGWKRSWTSSEDNSTVIVPQQIHDLRMDTPDDSGGGGFLDNIVRKFSKEMFLPSCEY